MMVRAWPAATFSRSAMECGAPERVCHSILWPHSAFFNCLSMSSLSRSASTTTGLHRLIYHKEMYMAVRGEAVAAYCMVHLVSWSLQSICEGSLAVCTGSLTAINRYLKLRGDYLHLQAGGSH